MDVGNQGAPGKYTAPELLEKSSHHNIQVPLAAEVYSLGLIALETLDIEHKVWKTLPTIEDAFMYDMNLKMIIQRLNPNIKTNGKFSDMITAMIARDPQERLRESLKFLANAIADPTLNSDIMLVPMIKRRNLMINENKTQVEEMKIEIPQQVHQMNIGFNQIVLLNPHVQPDVEIEKINPDLRDIIEVMKPKGVKVIDLHARDLNDMDITAIGQNFSWVNLRKLLLYQNQFGDKGAIALGKNTVRAELRILDLARNNIGDEGCEVLAKNKTWTRLETVYLNKNAIGDKGAVALGSNTTWKNLKELSVGVNKIGDEGGAAIGSNKTWKNLESFNFYQNELGDAGVIALGANTIWSRLKHLYLWNNPRISDIGISALRSNKLFGPVVNFERQ